MKKAAVVVLAAFALSACGSDQELIQKSMNNIKDEMLGIQSTMGDMQVKMQELDKNIRINSENINKNSEGLSQLREELTVMNTDIIDLKDRVSELEKRPASSKSADMPVDAMIILSCLRHKRRLTASVLIAASQKPEQGTRTDIEKLVNMGIVEAHGAG